VLENEPSILKVPAPVKVIRQPEVPEVTAPFIVTVPDEIEITLFLPDVVAFIVSDAAESDPVPTFIVQVKPDEGLAIVKEPDIESEFVLLIVTVVFALTVVNDTDAQLNIPSTVRVAPLAIVTASTGPTPWERKEIPVLFEAAADTRVRCVLSVIEATVPIETLPVVFIIFPALSSVVNRVPEPVTVRETVEVVINPVRLVFGQAVALQLPEVLLVIFAACKETTKNDTKIVRNVLTSCSLNDCPLIFFMLIFLATNKQGTCQTIHLAICQYISGCII
jgi:hypothetical protein